jgi:hypothetical protein
MSATRDIQPAWLFCVGAQKAGTTWLYDYLSQHPEAHVPPVKELHYFNARFDPRQEGFAKIRRENQAKIEARGALRGALHGASRSLKLHRLWRDENPGDVLSDELIGALVAMHDDPSEGHERYRALVLRGWSGEKLVADITPDYATMAPGVFGRMAADFPGAKFLFILRDPVTRTWSHIRMARDRMAQRLKRAVSADEILDKLEAGGQQHILQRSFYHRTVRALRDNVDADKVLFLFHETLFDDASIRRLCDFLGLGFVPGDYGKQVREGRAEAMSPAQGARIRALVAPVYEQMLRIFGDDLPAQWDQDMMAKARVALQAKRAENRQARLANAG